MSDKEEIKYGYGNKSVVSLVKEQYKLKLKIEQLKAESSALTAKYDYLRKELLPDVMESMELDRMAVTGVGRVNLRPELYVSIVSGRKEEFHAWLKKNGHSALVKPEVNSSTLKSFIKEQIKEGKELPDYLLKIDPYMMATITKS